MSITNATNGKTYKGTVKFFDRKKGFGFILRPGDRDVFIHAKDLPENTLDLRPDQLVEYTLEDNDRGPRARNIALVK